MMKRAAVIGVAVAVLIGIVANGRVGAHESDVLVRFDDAVGVTPILSFAPPQAGDLTFANVAPNLVRGVTPSGNPWKIDDLKAVVHADGRIRVVGRGLMISGGNLIGQSLSLRIFATLICELTPPFVPHSTNSDPQQPDPVQLDANGDFRIDDTLTSVPTECAAPVLLIRALSNSTWIAAALPKDLAR
jgi:hypothetical protein